MPDKHMLSPMKQVTRLQLNLGVLAELFLVFLVSQAAELQDLVKVLLETCAEVVACSAQPRSGADGTERSV